MIVQRVALHVGNRGLVLALLGVIWCLTAVGLAVEARRLGLLDEWVPLPVRVGMWLLPGLFALVSAVWRQLDDWAWGLLIFAPAIRLLAYLWAWWVAPLVAWLFDVDVTGAYPNAWRGACVYLAVVLLVNRCAAGLDRPAPWDGRERRRWTPPHGEQ